MKKELHASNSRFQRKRTRKQTQVLFTLAMLLFVRISIYSQNPAGNLDQARNGSSSNPISPINWVNGNVGSNNGHYIEGYSIPYRLKLTNLTPGSTYSVKIEWDIKHGGKHAIDYVTRYNWIDDPSHNGTFGHGTEVIDPLDGLSGMGAGVEVPFPATCPIPFTPNVPSGDRVMTIYNGTISSMTYLSCGDLNAAQSADRLRITFTCNAANGMVLLAWGGHIGREIDWGAGNSASSISGSPYHTRFIALCTPGNDGVINTSDDVCAGGNQDRSLSAVEDIEPCGTCEVSGPTTVCPGSTHTYSSPITGICNNPSRQWTVTGATITGSSTGTSVSVMAGSCGSSYTVTCTTECTGCDNSPIECSTEVTVGDITNPTITCPVPASPINCPAPPLFLSPSATDNCGTPSVNYEDETTPGTCAGTYTTVRTWTATDACANTATCSQSITVQDITPPQLTGSGNDATIDCPSAPSFTAPSASDECGTATVNVVSDVTSPGTCPGTYSRTITWDAVDDCGNRSVPVSQTITVQDITPPTITCPAQKNLLCGESNAPANTGSPTGSDECGTIGTFSFTDDASAASCGSTTGASYTRTWSVSDACGNISSCNQTITCGPCIEACALTQGFYGSISGQYYYNGANRNAVWMINYALTQYGPMVLGDVAGPGGSLTIPASAASCLNSLLPGSGTSKVFPNDFSLTSACVVSSTWKKNGKFASVLWGQGVTLWLNVKLFPNFCSLKLSQTCIDKPSFIPSSVVTVCDLLTYTSNVLGGNVVLNSTQLGLMSGYLGDLHNYYDECSMACGGYYVPSGMMPVNNNSNPVELVSERANNVVMDNQEPSFSVFPNPLSDQFTITLDAAQIGKSISVQIVNQLGQCVLTVSYKALLSEQIQMNAGGIPAGIYLILVTPDNDKPMSKTIEIVK